MSLSFSAPEFSVGSSSSDLYLIPDDGDLAITDNSQSQSQSSVRSKTKVHSKGPRSFIWNHAVKPSSDQKKVFNDDGDPVWRCVHCPTHLARLSEVKESSGTRAAFNHLKIKHGIEPDVSDTVRGLQKRKENIIRAFEKAQELQIARRSRTQQEVLRNSVDIGTLEKLIVR